MIYFIVNNNYHVVDFEGHLATLQKKDVSLIEIPHALDAYESTDFRRFTYTRAAETGLIAQINNFLKNVQRINQEIQPAKEDFLFMYTECEILNQYLANRFKQAGAQIYLIEDGGLGTYVPFRLIVSESLTLKEWTKQTIYRLLPGLSKIRLHKLNDYIFEWMPDDTINGVCTYESVPLLRSIKTILLKRNHNPHLNLISGRTVFLNEPIYGVYQNSEEYISGLKNIMEALCRAFDEVFFKYHPRETEEWRLKIRNNVLSKYPNLTILEENSAVETLVGKYRPAVASSYFCSALLSLSQRGIEPLYLYHLLPDLKQQIISREVTAVLGGVGYNYVPSFSEIFSDFKSGLVSRPHEKTAIALAELVCHQ